MLSQLQCEKRVRVKKVSENGKLSERRMQEGKRVEKKLSLKRGAWREVMKHRDVWVDPGNDELASPAFQPPFHKAFPQFHSSLFLVCSPFEFS
jgi:hypothetical protein